MHQSQVVHARKYLTWEKQLLYGLQEKKTTQELMTMNKTTVVYVKEKNVICIKGM